jgi:hypothetical protein
LSESKKRHGCLTAFLIFILIANAAAALMFIFGGQMIKENAPEIAAWTLPLLAIGAVLNLVFAIALFKWKKWGFWGVLVTSIAGLVLNIVAGYGIGQSLTGLIVLAVLYGVLHIGKDNRGWPQLE